MTMTESNPWDLGSPMIRLMEMEENGSGDSTAKGDSPGMVGWVLRLAQVGTNIDS